MLHGVFLAIRLDYDRVLLTTPAVARQVGTILSRPCFHTMNRVRARRPDGWTRGARPAEAGAEKITALLTDPEVDAILLDTTLSRALSLQATAELESGVTHGPPLYATRSRAIIVLPLAAGELEAVMASVCDLAAALRIFAGFVAVEETHRLAQDIALGGRLRLRMGTSPQRFRERWERLRRGQHIDTQIAGVEWGTFLGPGHLSRTSLEVIRNSRAFARVTQLSAEVAYLQVTNDPVDDLTEAMEPNLVAARKALGALLMDVPVSMSW